MSTGEQVGILEEMELYHVLNRGVDKRTIFLDDRDRFRFVHDLYEFNDQHSALTFRDPSVDIVSPQMRHRHRERSLLVDIHGWCLMKNHYHLLLSERVEGGMSLFLRKLNVGYAKYFNEKHKRSGYLFQGRTKKVLIEHDAQFNYILPYIHLNPLDYLKGAEGWRIRSKGKGIKSVKAALHYLENYRWSSYLDYCGKKNFPSILTTDFFANGKEHQDMIREYLEGDENGENEYAPLLLE